MILSSLLKVLGISIISCLSFAEVDSSSVVHTEEQSIVSSKIGKKYAYEWLDSNEDAYINISSSDFDNDFFVDVPNSRELDQDNSEVWITLTNPISVEFGYLGRNSEEHVLTQSITKVQYILNHSNPDYFDGFYLDFMNIISNKWNTLYIDFEASVFEYTVRANINTTYDLTYVNLPYNSEAVYVDIYYTLMDYIYNSFSYSISSRNLNSKVFKGLSEWFVSKYNEMDYFGDFIYIEYDGRKNLSQLSEHKIQTGFINPQVILPFDDTYSNKPKYIWGTEVGSDYEIQNFSSDLVFYFGREDIMNDFIYWVNYDISNSDYDSLLIYDSFTFDNQFNYNAPYNTSRDFAVVSDPYFTATQTNDKSVYTFVPFFYSNGYLFDCIECVYTNAYEKYFYVMADTGTNYFKYFDQVGYGYFTEMYYVNSNTNLRVRVYYRTEGNFTDGQGVQQDYYGYSAEWVNSDYRYLGFIQQLRSDQLDRLTIFNQNGEMTASSGENGALKNSFKLINLCLVGLTGFFGYNILPGITLGTLFLIPFAVTLMLFVIRLFKR